MAPKKLRADAGPVAVLDGVLIDRISSLPWALSQMQAIEKQVFAKADSWAAIMPQEVNRRNTITLVAYEPGPRPAQASQDDEASEAWEWGTGEVKEQPSGPQVVGYILLTTNGLAVHVSKLAVRDDCRRRGIALQLFKAALLVATRERRVCCSTLHVAAENAPALALYTKIGYTSEAFLPDYYGPGRHAHKMMCDLEASQLFQAWLQP